MFMPQFAPLLRKDHQQVRYLVVDDSVFARKNIMKMIEIFGGVVAGEAGDGLTAIAEFNRIKPDIVLMDITMPQMEGIEAVDRIVMSMRTMSGLMRLNSAMAVRPTSSSWTSPCPRWKASKPSTASCANMPTRASSWSPPSATRKTFLPLCKRAPSILSRSPLSPKFSTKSFVTFSVTIQMPRVRPLLSRGSIKYENGTHPAFY